MLCVEPHSRGSRPGPGQHAVAPFSHLFEIISLDKDAGGNKQRAGYQRREVVQRKTRNQHALAGLFRIVVNLDFGLPPVFILQLAQRTHGLVDAIGEGDPLSLVGLARGRVTVSEIDDPGRGFVRAPVGLPAPVDSLPESRRMEFAGYHGPAFAGGCLVYSVTKESTSQSADENETISDYQYQSIFHFSPNCSWLQSINPEQRLVVNARRIDATRQCRVELHALVVWQVRFYHMTSLHPRQLFRKSGLAKAI